MLAPTTLGAALHEQLQDETPTNLLLTAQLLEHLRVAAALHDVGKIGIAEEILNALAQLPELLQQRRQRTRPWWQRAAEGV